ncbi:MAG: hypothetical protein ABI557_05080 [Aureliella sp.]
MDLAIDQTGLGNRWSLAAGLAGWGLSAVTDVAASAALLRSRRSGQIVTQAGRLRAIYGRWWPYAGNLLQAKWDARLRPMAGDRCELFYHQSGAEGGFLTLAYVRSGKSTSVSTCYAATLVLDEIARLKQSGAMVCHVANGRISHRLLERWGWQAHCLQWKGRHYIKRLYGNYPSIAPQWRTRLTLDRR